MVATMPGHALRGFNMSNTPHSVIGSLFPLPSIQIQTFKFNLKTPLSVLQEAQFAHPVRLTSSATGLGDFKSNT